MIILLVVSLSVRSGWFLCFKWGQFLVHLTKWALKWGRVLGVVKIDRAGSPGDAESYYSAAPPPNLHNTPHARPHTRTFTSNTTHTHTSAWFQKVERHFGVSVQYKRFQYAPPAPPSTTMYQVHTMNPTKYSWPIFVHTLSSPPSSCDPHACHVRRVEVYLEGQDTSIPGSTIAHGGTIHRRTTLGTMGFALKISFSWVPKENMGKLPK